MRKIIDDQKLIYRCCRMYYEDRMEQQKIADALCVSRTTVSRLPNAGRDLGIVTITVNRPDGASAYSLEERMMDLFPLKEVVVVEDSPLNRRDTFIEEISVRAMHLIRSYIREKDVVGVSMGKTLYDVCHSREKGFEPVDCTFVPLVGGLSSGTQLSENFNSNRIAADMARSFKGEYVEFFSPALFSDRKVLEGFMQEAPIRRIFQYYRKMNTVIMGIGIPNRGGSSMVKAGYIKPEELDEMVERGMVGDLSLQFFDEFGNEELFHDFNKRVAGMPLSQILQVENRITVVMRGVSQARALYAAIRGGYTNIVVLDQRCASRLIAWREEEMNSSKI